MCPTCRVPLTQVFKSFKHKNLIEMLLEHRPDLNRDPLILGQLNATNIFTNERFDVEESKKEESQKVPAAAIDKPVSPSSDSSSESSQLLARRKPIRRRQIAAKKKPAAAPMR